MKNRLEIILTAVVAAALMASCATTKLAVQRMAPASYDIEDVKKLGILGFSSEHPAYTSAARGITDIIEDKLVQNGFFEKVTRVKSYNGMPVETTPAIFPELLAKIGREAGVDLLVLGLVDIFDANTFTENRKKEEEVSTGRYRTETYAENGETKTRQVEIKEKKVYYVPYAKRRAGVKFRAYALRIEGGRFAGKGEFKDQRIYEGEGRDKIDSFPSEQQLLSELTDKLTQIFVNQMTPHEVTEYVKLRSSKQCKAGVKLAREGKWIEAIAEFENVVASDPSNDVAFFNLGAAHEYSKDYEKAREYYRSAMAIRNKPEYNEAWVRVHDITIQNMRLERQLKGKK